MRDIAPTMQEPDVDEIDEEAAVHLDIDLPVDVDFSSHALRFYALLAQDRLYLEEERCKNESYHLPACLCYRWSTVSRVWTPFRSGV